MFKRRQPRSGGSSGGGGQLSTQHAAATNSSTNSSTNSLQRLGDLPLRLIALKLSNPGPLAATCVAAHTCIAAQPDFALEWFWRWVHILVPFRPWQHAVITWQRVGGGRTATAEQLCEFLLQASAAKSQQQKALALQLPCSSGTQPAAGPPQDSPPLELPEQQQLPQQQQQQQEQQQQVDNEAQEQPKPPPTPKFSPMPHCVPLPSVLQQARKQLARGSGVQALVLLCPGPAWLLYQHAAAAGRLQLLQQLLEWQQKFKFAPYPAKHVVLSDFGSQIVNVAQLCAYAALKAGHTDVLTSVLTSGGASIKSRRYQVGQLFRFAVKRSSAACLQHLLSFVPRADEHTPVPLQPWPQHLAMAAARTDAWAAGVVQLLLQVMNPKLLAAKYMWPVYTAACRTGHMPVLQLLLDHAAAAAAPGLHVSVLFKAAAAARNLHVWQRLLAVSEGTAADSAAGGAAADIGGSDSMRTATAAANGDGSSGTDSSSNGSSATNRLLSYLSGWFVPAQSAPPHQQQQQQHQQQQQEEEAQALPLQPSLQRAEQAPQPLVRNL